LATQKYLIAAFKTGLEKDIAPWMLPEDAFSLLNNAFVFRGRVIKRFGSSFLNLTVASNITQLYSRLKIDTGIATDGAGNAVGNVPGIKYGIGQMFSIGDEMFTVVANGAPAALLSTGNGTGTYNTVTGAFTFNGADSQLTTIYFYPADPVMGFANLETSEINKEPTIAFDTQFAYQYDGTQWNRLAGGDDTWTGTNSQFFWTTNWRGSESYVFILFATNFTNETQTIFDPARWYNPLTTTWTDFKPVVNGTYRLRSGRIIIPFHDRLLFLNTLENEEGSNIGTSNAATGKFTLTPFNPPGGVVVGSSFLIGTNLFTVTSIAAGPQVMTVEGIGKVLATGTWDSATFTVDIIGNNENKKMPVFFLPNNGTGTMRNFGNRCRFSQNGNPLKTNGMIDLIGKGGFIEAATKESIISAEFIKDHLIVYFERSTWEFVYLANQVQPFRWQRINTELGAESTFSSVSFDKEVIAIGNVGVHSCNGANVSRIDQKIPDDIYEIHNGLQGITRVHGIRDFFVECIYWTVPDPEDDPNENPTFPTRLLVYNYENGTWAYFNDSITAFGYYQDASNDFERYVVCGNQQGFTFLALSLKGIVTIGQEIFSTRNAGALQITNITIGANTVTFTVINHNLPLTTYVYIENVIGVAGLNGNIFEILVVTNDTFTIPLTAAIVGVYNGAGTIARVTPPDIDTKQFNFFVSNDRNVFIQKINFLIDSDVGNVTIDYFNSFSFMNMIEESKLTGTILGTGTLALAPYASVPFETFQKSLWHPIYLQADGENIKLKIYLSKAQTLNVTYAHSGFVLHAMLIYAMPTSSIQQ